MISRTIEIDVSPTPNELAACFCGMSAAGQAMFFNEIAELVKRWDKPFGFQLQAVIDAAILTASGKAVMREIGVYGE